MDVGTAFGGIGSSREMMIASLAEPAMLLVVFTVALIAGTTQLSAIAETFVDCRRRAARLARPCACSPSYCVAIAENARIPIDNPATHLELTMVHEAMVLEYSGRHLAMIEAAAALKLALYFSLFACLFVPFGMATTDKGPERAGASGSAAYLGKIRAACGRCCRSARPRSPRCGCSAIRFSSAAHSRRARSRCSCCSCRGASDDARSPSTWRICSRAPCWC